MRQAAKLISLLLALFVSRAVGAERSLLTGGDLDLLVQRGLLARDPARVRRALGAYAARVMAEGVDLGTVLVGSTEAMECVLARAVARSATLISVFTEDLFLRQQHTAVLIERATLAELAGAFDFHTAFPVVVQLRDGGTATMQFLLVGQGRLIIGYDRAGTYDHPDPAYGVKILIKTLRGYEIGRYVRMEIARDGDGHRVLRDLQIADGPQGAPGPFRGPGDFEVRQLIVEGPHMKVVTAWKDVTIDPPPVTERARDRGRPDRLAARGCPVQGAWTKAPPSAAW